MLFSIASLVADIRKPVSRRVAHVARHWGRMPIPRRFAYPAVGLAVTVGFTFGLLLVRTNGLAWAIVFDELAGELRTYTYVALAAAAMFVGLGAALGYQTDRLLALSTTDPLTGLCNHRALERRLDEEIPRSARCGQPLSVLLVDLDKFKSVNDRWGHITGDRVLRAMAHTIRGIVRTTDRAGRVGGDEFAIVAPDTGQAAATRLAQRVRVAIEREAHRLHQPVTASVGISTFTPHGPGHVDRLAIMNAADIALYAAKHRGGNRIEFAQRRVEPISRAPVPTSEPRMARV